MNLPSEDVTKCVDQLIQASQDFERKLENEGISQAHEWMFAIREMLYDLRRLHLSLSNIYRNASRDQAPLLVQDFVRTVLYEVIPHVQDHMKNLEENVSATLPEIDSSENSDRGLE